MTMRTLVPAILATMTLAGCVVAPPPNGTGSAAVGGGSMEAVVRDVRHARAHAGVVWRAHRSREDHRYHPLLRRRLQHARLVVRLDGARKLAKAGVDAKYVEIDTDFRHRASGADWRKWASAIKEFLTAIER